LNDQPEEENVDDEKRLNDQPEEKDADDESDDADAPPVRSKYFGEMAAKRTLNDQGDDTDYHKPDAHVKKLKPRKKRRRATHDYEESDQDSLSFTLFEMENAPPSPKTANHKSYRARRFPDDSRCDACFRN
jgi:hypothetical protein